MSKALTRLSKFELLCVTVVKDVISAMDERYMDDMEDLIDLPSEEDFHTDEGEQKFADDLEALEKRVCARVAKALTNYSENKSDDVLGGAFTLLGVPQRTRIDG